MYKNCSFNVGNGKVRVGGIRRYLDLNIGRCPVLGRIIFLGLGPKNEEQRSSHQYRHQDQSDNAEKCSIMHLYYLLKFICQPGFYGDGHRNGGYLHPRKIEGNGDGIAGGNLQRVTIHHGQLRLCDAIIPSAVF